MKTSYDFSRFGLLSGVIFTLLIFVSYSTSDPEPKDSDETSTAKTAETYKLPQQVYPIRIGSVVTFAGENIPMNIDTRERLDRELLVNSYWHSSTLLNLKMANKYFPVIERILAEQNVPDDFKYLAVAESNLRNVVSSARAKGFWQFRKLAAKEWKLEVNDEVDERYHIEKSTEAAAKYLKRLYKRFGSWSNAAAAYNVGPTSFAKSLKQQGEEHFYDLNVNDETARYVFRLTAMKEIMKNPSSFGFYVNPEDLYQPLDNYYEIKIDKSVPSWAAFAEEKGITYRMLKYYNPWLRSNKLTVKNNTYYVKIPRSS